MMYFVLMMLLFGVVSIVIVYVQAPTAFSAIFRGLANKGTKLPRFLYMIDMHTAHLIPLLERNARIEDKRQDTLQINFKEGWFDIEASWHGRISISSAEFGQPSPLYTYRINYQVELKSRLPEGVRLTTSKEVVSPEYAKNLPIKEGEVLSWRDTNAPGSEVLGVWRQALALAAPPNTREVASSRMASRANRPDKINFAANKLQCVYSGVAHQSDAREYMVERVEDQIREVVWLAKLCEFWDEDSLEMQCVAHVLVEEDVSTRSFALNVLLRMYRWRLDRAADLDEEDQSRLHAQHDAVVERFFEHGLSWEYTFFVDALTRGQLDAMDTAQLREVVEQTADARAAKLLERRLDLFEVLEDTAFSLARRIEMLGEAVRDGDVDLDLLLPWLDALRDEDFGSALVVLMAAPDHAIWRSDVFERALNTRLASAGQGIHRRTYTAWRQYSHLTLPMAVMVERLYQQLFEQGAPHLSLDWGLTLIAARQAKGLDIAQVKRLLDATSSSRVSEALLSDEPAEAFELFIILTGSVLGHTHRHEVLSSSTLRLAAIERLIDLLKSERLQVHEDKLSWCDELVEALFVQELLASDGFVSGTRDRVQVYVDYVERTGHRKSAMGALFAIKEAAAPKVRADLELVLESWASQLGGANVGALTHVDHGDRAGGLSEVPVPEAGDL